MTDEAKPVPQPMTPEREAAFRKAWSEHQRQDWPVNTINGLLATIDAARADLATAVWERDAAAASHESGEPPRGSRLWRCELELRKARELAGARLDDVLTAKRECGDAKREAQNNRDRWYASQAQLSAAQREAETLREDLLDAREEVACVTRAWDAWLPKDKPQDIDFCHQVIAHFTSRIVEELKDLKQRTRTAERERDDAKRETEEARADARDADETSKRCAEQYDLARRQLAEMREAIEDARGDYAGLSSNWGRDIQRRLADILAASLSAAVPAKEGPGEGPDEDPSGYPTLVRP